MHNMEVGDLVKQRGSGVAVISEFIKQNLNLGLIGIIIEIINNTDHTYDGKPRNDLVIQWSNGNVEKLSEIYLEKLENNT